MDKKSIRREMLDKRCNMNPEELKRKSRKIMTRLLSLPEYKHAEVIMFFNSIRNEVQTEAGIRASLKSGRQVVVPVTDTKNRRLIPSLLSDPEKELTLGTYGVPEPSKEYIRPISKEEIDLVVTPGAAFDRQGNRIGYGGGYYDRFFSNLPQSTVKVAVAFSFQIAETLIHAVDESDVPVDAIVTECEVIDCS